MWSLSLKNSNFGVQDFRGTILQIVDLSFTFNRSGFEKQSQQLPVFFLTLLI